MRQMCYMVKLIGKKFAEKCITSIIYKWGGVYMASNVICTGNSVGSYILLVITF